uniref:D-alanyl-D-alanine dipeptidase n=2 Tax=Candidatus Kentrum sp. FM TaxID=2126340 RepID=A0A450SKG4_9GAMM|nr:MAG: D-alanyl-D-alanine dipeptidase [Candidatus Kentron sp. FM]VFJ54428.1 MAG: D-alanyl-D-alanine dipeptidase [Candidatus Kentron sp. FM]
MSRRFDRRESVFSSTIVFTTSTVWYSHSAPRRLDTAYPSVDKSELFAQGYIAAQSSHSRGSAVDVTLITVSSQGGAEVDITEMDMGAPFDFFDRISWPDYGGISSQQRANRLLLRLVMEKHGFLPYPQEWWHFRLKDEWFPTTYFDFPVR